MLPGHRTLKFEDEIADRVRNGYHFFLFALFLEVNERSNVHTADGAVTVVTGNGIVTGNDLAEAPYKFRKFSRLNGRVFNKGDGFFIARSTEQQSKTRLTHSPDRFDLLGLESQCSGIADPLRFAQLFEFV